MELHLKIAGSLLMCLAIMHVFFPWKFNWKEELKDNSLLTKQILYVHTFFIGLVVFMIGLLSFFYSDLLLKEKLGKIICMGISFFWFLRLIFQFFVYSRSLWIGKFFETCVHVIFIVMWSYFTWVYFQSAFVAN